MCTFVFRAFRAFRANGVCSCVAQCVAHLFSLFRKLRVYCRRTCMPPSEFFFCFHTACFLCSQLQFLFPPRLSSRSPTNSLLQDNIPRSKQNSLSLPLFFYTTTEKKSKKSACKGRARFLNYCPSTLSLHTRQYEALLHYLIVAFFHRFVLSPLPTKKHTHTRSI